MKKYLLILFGATLISSCNSADESTANALAKEMCDALSGVDAEDPSGLLDAAMKMMEISENEDYANVSELQLENAMKEKCPDGWKAFEELSEME
ncbi:MAG: hypothetical protein CL846_06465 [Crocinitomicaceae bacterium]|nr:hypothetical protein [Crocinitomicaceae bacterium]|tara:strand:+ start:1724 stop:2005 length:282 start_codon:yes stop_codon:yes gene_type:complete